MNATRDAAGRRIAERRSARVAEVIEAITDALGERPRGHYWCSHRGRYTRWDECEVRSAGACLACGRRYRPGDGDVVADECRWQHMHCREA